MPPHAGRGRLQYNAGTNDEEHDPADLLDIVSTLVGQYEDSNHPELPPVEPREVLRFLMEQHGLKQTDLTKELGGQSVVSDNLAADAN